ncbi:DUF655 domain-containing protein [Orrella sp. NBD-18]|uniref:DUF655 domain-containing protein n=1 Tax=Sheuella amnicola TaxID=2707330 RepID=A0A6B2R3N4_9BURK|nr:helix-hairpin-helix domain-containing protein [Sheuella amnicola]NDY83667.1 DUF655 domain-containing protein [Sheuella amnicola]HBI83956.1 DUF655 domain-containing protein [Alcaligenaceae bacterium]
MNPFLYDTVAKPLSESGLALLSHRVKSRRAGVIALVAAAGMSSFSAQALDVNVATQSELQTIKGVGPRTAQIIVQERQRAGNFESLQDLSERVRGIGLKKLQAMQQAGLAVNVKPGQRNRAPQVKGTPALERVDPIVTDVD